MFIQSNRDIISLTNGDCKITAAKLQSFSESNLAARSTVGPVPSDLPYRTMRDGSTAGDLSLKVPFSSA
jgi:hypothetical protein